MIYLKYIYKYSLIFVLHLLLPLIILVAYVSRLFRSKITKPRLLWGFDPLINHKYHSKALQEHYESTSCVVNFFSINKKDDFDIILTYERKIHYFINSLQLLFKYDIYHLSFNGGLFSKLGLGKFEPYIFKIAGIKTIMIAYGSDASVYDLIENKVYSHVLMCDYPQNFERRKQVHNQLVRWCKHADIIIPSMFIPFGFPRWDIVAPNILTIDTSKFPKNKKKVKRKVFTVVHSPNHKAIKGSEYIINAVNELAEEGLNIKLLLLEGVKNDQVLKILNEEADLLVEKLIGPSYALSAIEGMSAGLPVINNLNTSDWNKEMMIYYQYSFLSECPILSANYKNIKEVIREVYNSPTLQTKLGELGQKYVEKYHSYNATNYVFNNIYEKIWFNKDINLMNLFHPLKSEYVKNNYIQTPLVNNRYIPKEEV